MQFIYTMKGLGTIHPPDTQVLRDIWLSFFPGLAIVITTVSATILAAWARIATDPGQRWRLTVPQKRLSRFASSRAAPSRRRRCASSAGRKQKRIGHFYDAAVGRRE